MRSRGVADGKIAQLVDGIEAILRLHPQHDGNTALQPVLAFHVVVVLPIILIQVQCNADGTTRSARHFPSNPFHLSCRYTK